MVVGKWKAFYTHRRIPGPIFITNPFLSSALSNTSTLHYGLILIKPGSRVTATSSSSKVRTTNSMVTKTKSVVLFRLQVYN